MLSLSQWSDDETTTVVTVSVTPAFTTWTVCFERFYNAKSTILRKLPLKHLSIPHLQSLLWLFPTFHTLLDCSLVFPTYPATAYIWKSFLYYFLQAPEFPEFCSEVQEAINSLGGCVFPKLNWSAPRVSWTLASSRVHVTNKNNLYGDLKANTLVIHLNDISWSEDKF